MNLHLVVGARPNFMKVAPLWHALKRVEKIRPVLVHTGQHYSENMSTAILNDLNLPKPDFNLGVRGGSHAHQTAKIMTGYEEVCLSSPPSCLLVVGDVNSTLATALVAKKMNVPVVHLEAGLRSFDRSMPEEINRLVTDAISDLLLTPSVDADENLLREGVDKGKIVRVGNIMIDSFEMLRDRIEQEKIYNKLGLIERNYCVVTIHRPSNVDDHVQLRKVVDVIKEVSRENTVCFPIHPRTLNNLNNIECTDELVKCNVRMIDPMPYVQFMSLVKGAKFIITDSGGVQEETSYLGIDCFTLRDNTERPITVSLGTNHLVNVSNVIEKIEVVLKRSKRRQKNEIDMWDGQTAYRVVDALKSFLEV